MKKLMLLFVATAMILSTASAGEGEVILKTATGDIHGTLRMPDVHPDDIPLVIIIAGSGPTDRNGNGPQLKTDVYKMLADSLAAHGIASLRYDKRLLAASATGQTEKDLRLENYIGDAKAWVSEYAGNECFSKIVIAGHSEGSLIGIAASGNNPAVAGMISISGIGRPMDAVLKEQLAILPDELKGPAFATVDRLKAGEETADYPKDLGGLFRPSVQPYLISCFRYDPCAEIAKLSIPVLIVQGTTDIQVAVEDAELLAAAYPEARKMIIENMNHVLKNCTSSDRMAQMGFYTDPSLPLDGRLVSACVEFVGSL